MVFERIRYNVGGGRLGFVCSSAWVDDCGLMFDVARKMSNDDNDLNKLQK